MTLVADLDASKQRIKLISEWLHKDTLRGLPGSKWDAADKVWELPISWASCCMLRHALGDELQIGPALRQWATQQRAERIDPALQLRNQLEFTPDGSKLAEVIAGFEGPYGYQRVGAQFLVTAEDALLADSMGVGKTCTTLSAIRALDELGRDPYPVLVVTPNSVKTQWAGETQRWLPDAHPYVISGTAVARRKKLAQAAADPRALIIVNIEAVRTMSRLAPYGSIRLLRCADCAKPHHASDGVPVPIARCETHPKELNSIPFRTCVLDEGHRVKDPKAKQTRGIWHVFHSETVRNRWVLTGTPIANNPADLWSLMHAVAPSDYQTRSKFVERFAQVSWNGFGMEILGLRPERRAELFSFLDPRMRRVTKDLVLRQLPPKVYSTRVVEMSPKQKKAYDSLDKTAFAELEDGNKLVASTNLVLSTRLLQLASSYCQISYGADPDDFASWEVTPSEPSPKIDELMAIVQELDGESLAVVAEHRRLLDLVAARLTKHQVPYVAITGAVDEHQRALNLARFREGRVPVLLFTSQAGGVGLNMTRAGTLVRLQRSWSLVSHQQAEDRIHRIGSEQHSSVNIIDIIAEGTVEDTQLDALMLKNERLEQILRDRESRRLHGLDASDLDLLEAEILAAPLAGS